MTHFIKIQFIMLKRKLKYKLLILFFIFVSALLTFASWSIELPKLEAFFYDFHVSFFKRETVSQNLKLVHLTPLNEKTFLETKFSLEMHKNLISKLFDTGAAKIFYAVDPNLFLTNEENFPIENFLKFTQNYPNL